MTKAINEEEINAGDTINAVGISWDISGDDDEGEMPELPENAEIKIPFDWEFGDSVADLLSDQYGFCINSIESLEREDG